MPKICAQSRRVDGANFIDAMPVSIGHAVRAQNQRAHLDKGRIQSKCGTVISTKRRIRSNAGSGHAANHNSWKGGQGWQRQCVHLYRHYLSASSLTKPQAIASINAVDSPLEDSRTSTRRHKTSTWLLLYHGNPSTGTRPFQCRKGSQRTNLTMR